MRIRSHLLLFFLVLFLTSCGAKKKASTRHKNKAAMETSVTAADSVLATEKTSLAQSAKAGRLSLENAIRRTVDSTVSIVLTPIDPERPSTAKVAGKEIRFQNTSVRIGTGRTKTVERSNTAKVETAKDTIQKTSTQKKERHSLAKATQKVQKSAEKTTETKEKTGGLPFWAWGIAIILVLAVLLFIYRKIKHKIIGL